MCVFPRNVSQITRFDIRDNAQCHLQKLPNEISTVANVIKLQVLESRGIQAAKCKLTSIRRDIFYYSNSPHIHTHPHIYSYRYSHTHTFNKYMQRGAECVSQRQEFRWKRKFSVEPLPPVSRQQRVLATNAAATPTADTTQITNVFIPICRT